MKINNVELEKVAVDREHYPSNDLFEIAFAGRSNVGKSSFINSIINRKNLARISSKPGKTRTINFYNVNGDFRFVDLPGYGYARVSKSEKEKWGFIIEEYLNTRENLLEVILIVDIRHKPTDQDLMMYDWIKTFDFKGIVIATKADKISRGKYKSSIKAIKDKLEIEDESLIIPYSASKNINRDKVWHSFREVLEK